MSDRAGQESMTCRGRRERDGLPCGSTVLLANGYCKAHQDQASNSWKRLSLWWKATRNRYWWLAAMIVIAGLVATSIELYNAVTGRPLIEVEATATATPEPGAMLRFDVETATDCWPICKLMLWGSEPVFGADTQVWPSEDYFGAGRVITTTAAQFGDTPPDGILPEGAEFTPSCGGLGIDVGLTNESSNEWLRVETKLLARIDEVNSLEEPVHVFAPWGAGPGEIYTYTLRLTQDMAGKEVEITPVIDSGVLDYYKLQPGEPEWLEVYPECLDPGAYTFALGVTYSDRGIQGRMWGKDENTVIRPRRFYLWLVEYGYMGLSGLFEWNPVIEEWTATCHPTIHKWLMPDISGGQPSVMNPESAGLAAPLFSDRPCAFDDYPESMAEYLTVGGSAEGLERLLRDWGAITDIGGTVTQADLTGDSLPEVVVSLMEPIGGGVEWGMEPVWNLIVFRHNGKQADVVMQARYGDSKEWTWTKFDLLGIEDINKNGLLELIYLSSACGGMDCWSQLHVVEWNGSDFVNLIADAEPYIFLEYVPSPVFTFGDGYILVTIEPAESFSGGTYRGREDVWTWNGQIFALSEQKLGSPVTLVHMVHDGDNALAQGDCYAAITHYEQVLAAVDIPSGLFIEPREGMPPSPDRPAIVRAYAQFKLVVAWAAAGNGATAEVQYRLLLDENPQGSEGYPYVQLGEAFWESFARDKNASKACADVVAAAQHEPNAAQLLYAGEANPTYQASDLCKLDR